MAMVSKTHHAAVDGASGADLLAAMLQLVPDQPPPPPPDQPWEPEAEPSDLRLLVTSGLRLAATPLGVARMLRLRTSGSSRRRRPLPHRPHR